MQSSVNRIAGIVNTNFPKQPYDQGLYLYGSVTLL